MKKVVLSCALAVSLTAQTTITGTLTEPVVGPPVIIDEVTADSSESIWLPVVLLVWMDIAVAGEGGGVATAPVFGSACLGSA